MQRVLYGVLKLRTNELWVVGIEPELMFLVANASIGLEKVSMSMKLGFLLWPVLPACAGAAYGLLISSTDLSAAAFLGGAGLIAGGLGGMLVSGVHSGLKVDVKKTSVAGVVGALLGVVVGGYLGVTSGFGPWMIATFNPGLPEMDFRDPFGFIGGVFLVSVAGAIAMAGLVSVFQWKRAGNPASK